MNYKELNLLFQLLEFIKVTHRHILGYVSQASAEDLKNKEYLKDMSVPGIAVGNRIRKRLDEEIIGKVGFQRYEVNALEKN